MTKTPRPQALLFDLDGTLMDTAPDIAHSLNLALARLQFPNVSEDQIRGVISEGGNAIIEHCFGQTLSAFDRQQLKEHFYQIYRDQACQHARPFPGIQELLLNLKAQGLAWGIVTNRSTLLSQWMIQAHPFLQEAQCIVSADTTSHPKPHPAPLLHASESLNGSPQSSIFVGDSCIDMEAAKRAGMTALLVSYGYGPFPSLTDSPWSPNQVLNHPLDLLLYLNTWQPLSNLA